ncbi:undecaprenyl-phosphate glucose phosphotransferase [Rhodoblastus acidophilus]|nr:undecaprenyl-phosphate glucose phosphotransferase [Rhodoblastus acidophilus]
MAERLSSRIQPGSDAAPEGWGRPAFHVADLTRLRRPETAPGVEPWRGKAIPPDARISQPLLVGALLLFDVLNFPASGLLAYLATSAPRSLDWNEVWASLAVVTLVGLAALHARWSYTIRAMGDFTRQSLNLTLAFGGALALWNAGAVMAGFGAPELLRGWTLAWFCGGWAAGSLARGVFAVAVKIWTRQGRLARRTVIVGGGQHALETLGELERSGRGALQILGLFDDRNRDRLPEAIEDYALLGTFDDLEAFCREQKVDLLIVAIPTSAETRILQILKKLWILPVDIRISALGSRLKLRDRAYHHIGDVPFLPVFDKPISDWGSALKETFDRVVAALLILALSPVLAAVALGVKLSSPGPVLFRQTRYGFNNEQFAVFKFRSMYTEKCDASASKLVTRNDPRVTRFGAFIRRWSLDELPQLFNVLLGDLSLVGPRPHAIKGAAAGLFYDEAVEGYFARHRVKPGITGWAQVNGWRGETDTIEKIEQRVAHDLYYIENWSVWFDLKILAMTPISVMLTKNAF